MKNNDYISISKKLLLNLLSEKKKATFNVFLHLLLTADAKGKLLSSKKQLCSELGISQLEIDTALKKIERKGDITITVQQGSKLLISITDYQKFLEC